MKNPIADNSVQATMVLPLWGRATYSTLFPDILVDSKAQIILKQMLVDFDFDPGFIKQYYKNRIEYWGLVFCVRSRNMDDALQTYLKIHPSCTVVNMGAGMDTGYYRNDNGTLKWIDIDFPNVTELRNRYLPAVSQHQNLSKDILDNTWMDEIPFSKENGIFFIAGGFFLYFEEMQVKKLMITLTDRFPGGELIFDGSSKMGLKITNRRIRKENKTEMLWKFSLQKNVQKQFESWSTKLHVKDVYSYWDRTILNPKWNNTTKKLIKIASLLKWGKFIHLQFQQ